MLWQATQDALNTFMGGIDLAFELSLILIQVFDGLIDQSNFLGQAGDGCADRNQIAIGVTWEKWAKFTHIGIVALGKSLVLGRQFRPSYLDEWI